MEDKNDMMLYQLEQENARMKKALKEISAHQTEIRKLLDEVQDLLAEKEAVKINKSCDGFDLMLRDYLQAAQEGGIEEDDLGDLIDMLKEVEGYAQAGKLKIPGTKELTEIRKSIAAYTAALMKAQEKSPDERTGIPAAEEFRLIREQLTRQKDWLK